MATDVLKPSQPKPAEAFDLPQPSIVRWWVVPVLAFGAMLLLLVGAAAVFAIRWRMNTVAALRRVEKEVARLEALGQPISTQSLYDYHRVPADRPDATALWLAALNSLDEKAFNTDGKDLPFVGVLEGRALTPPGNPALLASAEDFLKKYDPTREAILAAVRHGGECRIPVKFEDGFAMLLPNAQKVRCLARLLALDIRVRACRGDAAGAVESLEALYGTAVTVAHQLTIVEQLIHMAVAGVAFGETEQLLGDLELTDEQLARIAARLDSLDIRGGLTTGMIGERAMGYYAFHHLEQVPEIPQLKGMGVAGQLSRPVDCEWYLQLFDDLIAASREPFPEARNRARAVEMRLKARAGSQNPLEKMNYMVTLMILPATGAAFDATGRTLAARETLRVAVAAERYRLATGAFPNQLTELVPAYLPAVPVDPFDGLPLRMKATSEELIVYSVGKDGQDNGGQETKPCEPDVVVRVPAKKAAPAP